METNQKSLKAMFWRTEFYGAITEGGTASLHIGKIRGLNKLGHKSCYVSSGPMVLPEYVNYYFIPFGKLLRNFPEILNLPYNTRSIKRIKQIIKVEKPDFILQHHHDFHYGGAMLKKQLGIPFLLHVDGIEYWIKKNWGKLYFSNLLKWAEEIQLLASDAIMVPSKTLGEQAAALGVAQEKIFVAPNGVDTDWFVPDMDGTDIINRYQLEGKYVVGFTGTFGHWHGVEVLAKAVKHIVSRIPEAIVMYVGDGMLRPNIEAIVKEDNMQDKVIVTGFVPYNDMTKYIAACDVLLSPCVSNPDGDFFNSPVKLFEYMGMQKPVIATPVGQQGDIIKDMFNGLHSEENQPEDIAEKVYRLYKDRDLALKLSKRARIDAVEKHDWKFNAQIIIDAYNYAISKRGN